MKRQLIAIFLCLLALSSVPTVAGQEDGFECSTDNALSTIEENPSTVSDIVADDLKECVETNPSDFSAPQKSKIKSWLEIAGYENVNISEEGKQGLWEVNKVSDEVRNSSVRTWLGPNSYVVSDDFDSSNETATLVISSQYAQSITITDSQSMEETQSDTGTYIAQSISLSEPGTYKVRVPATLADGEQLLTFGNTPRKTYIKSSDPALLPSIVSSNMLYLSGLSAIFGQILIGVVYIWWKRRKLKNGVIKIHDDWSP